MVKQGSTDRPIRMSGRETVLQDILKLHLLHRVIGDDGELVAFQENESQLFKDCGLE